MSSLLVTDETAPAASRRGRRVVSAGHAALIGVSLLPIGTYLWVALHRIRYPYELEWLEGGAVELVRRVSSGQGLYVSPTLDFTPWPYPPLYFWVSAGVAHVTGDGFFPLRLVACVCSLAVLALLACIVRQQGGSWTGGILAAGLYAATFELAGAWADIGRVDSMMLALLLAAVLVGGRARTWRGGIAMGLLFFLAFLTKQNALVAAVPALVWLVVYRRRQGIWASGTLAIAAVGSVVVGNAVTDGWYGHYVISELLGHAVESGQFLGFWAVDISPLILVLAFLAWWTVGQRRDWQTRGWSAFLERAYLPAVAVGFLAASLAGRLHTGGFANVLMPAMAGIALLVGLAASDVLRRPRAQQSRAAGWLAVGMAVQIAVLAYSPSALVPTRQDEAAGRQLVATLEALPGRVLVLDHPYYLTLAGRPTTSHLVAVTDVLRDPPGRAPNALRADLHTALDGVSVVILDHPGESDALGAPLAEDFVLLDEPLMTGDAFYPVSDIPRRPTYVYVRTSDLAAVERVLHP